MRTISLLLALPVTIFFAQQRFGNENPRFKGFTKSPTEHIMNEYDGMAELREMRGQVVDSSGAAIPNALFELRSKNPDDRIRGVKSKSDGSFQMHSVKDGVYVFKVTKDGFQSVFGTVRVNSKAPGNALKIELRTGV